MKELPFVKEKSGYSITVPENSEKLFFSNSELSAVGCRNCVWKMFSQCPYNLSGDETISKINPDHRDICPEMVSFIVSLAGEGDDIISVWEKFHIYKARLQESEDYRDFLTLQKEQEELKKTLIENGEFGNEESLNFLRYKELSMNKSSAKVWWIRLNEHVIKSLQKIKDREAKSKDSPKVPGIMAKNVNFLVTAGEVKQIDSNSHRN